MPGFPLPGGAPVAHCLPLQATSGLPATCYWVPPPTGRAQVSHTRGLLPWPRVLGPAGGRWQPGRTSREGCHNLSQNLHNRTAASESTRNVLGVRFQVVSPFGVAPL